jgi:hypothetical protein
MDSVELRHVARLYRGDGSGAPTMTLGDRGLHGVKRDVESAGPP